GFSYADVAKFFDGRPCERTVGEIVRRFRVTGDVTDDQALLSELADTMGHYLPGTQWSINDISLALHELGYVRKRVFTRAMEAREDAQASYRDVRISRELRDWRNSG
ncbi:hypothetical protein TSOC_014457, partial [Tetrabaena socialis]